MASLKQTFVGSIIDRAKAQPKTIVLPEGIEDRLILAAKKITEQKIARIILLGNEGTIAAKAKQLGLNLAAVTVIDPETSPDLKQYTNDYYELRKSKGMTLPEAEKTMKLTRFFGTMMLKKGKADGLVAGATYSTKDTIIPALQIIKTKPGMSIVSSLFFMVFDDKVFLFSDCGLVEFPNAEQLAEIALTTAETAKQFGIEQRIAMLSYSTKGSAASESVTKVVTATKIVQERIAQKYGANSPIVVDGELQGDAALVESVAKFKAPGSPIAGKAKILIFPNIDAGNICYKLTQRLGGADAYGPILQGMAKPVNDLSRGCTPDDIVGVVAITSVQAQG